MNTDTKRYVLRLIPSGVTVLTARSASGVVASTVTWMTQCSFEPPLLALGVKKGSFTYAVVGEAGAFCVNFLAAGQKAVAQKFFQRAEERDGMLSGERFEASPELGFPVFPSMLGYVECRVVAVVDRGDHGLLVAQVVGAGKYREGKPLLLADTGWNYGG